MACSLNNVEDDSTVSGYGLMKVCSCKIPVSSALVWLVPLLVMLHTPALAQDPDPFAPPALSPNEEPVLPPPRGPLSALAQVGG
jgi:hypothetical protein